jgi:hypothetical protein
VTLKSGTKVYPSQLRLQRLKDSESTNAEDAAAEEGWADVEGAVDNGNCAGLMDTWADGVSQDGLRTWYRVAAIRDGYTQYGPPTWAKCLYSAAPTVSAGTASIVSLESNAEGTAAVLKWKRKDYSAGGGIEFSWSEYSGAWNSTSGPTIAELDTEAASGTRNLDALTVGTRYYVRVRPYVVNANNEKQYGRYCDIMSVIVAADTGRARITEIIETAGLDGAELTISKTQANDAVEISWSDKYYAWTSNDEPDTCVATTGGTTVHWFVYGLEPGINYYFRVRPVDGETFGAYSDKVCFSIEPHQYSVGTAKVSAATTGEDGETVIVTVARSRGGDGVELAWSDDADAWESTDSPQSFEITEYGKSTSVHVKGLTEGTRYYFRARAFVEGNGDRVYSDWSAAKTATPYGPVGTVSASCADVAVRGRSLAVSWAHDGSSPQREWRVSLDGKVVLSGTGKRTAASITAATINALTNGAHSVVVSVSTGAAWANSNTCQFTVATAPAGDFSVSETVTAQPITLAYSGMTHSVTAALAIVAAGCAADDLRDAQPTGLTVWSGAFAVSNASGSVTLPEGIDLRDGASYELRGSITDESTGLSAELDAQEFSVAWAHQAIAPTVTVAVDADELSADITVTAPDGAAGTDVYDLWRVTPDGAYLIAEGRAFGTTAHDRYAPYCETRSDWTPTYRAVTRTADGDLDYTDESYELRSDLLRIDWGVGRSVALQYDLQGNDGWAKDFSSITHLDGTQGGAWARGTKRTAKLAGVMVRTDTSEQQAALRELAQWNGPAFVRVSNGSAYMAHVTVGTVAWTADSFKVSASISAQELELTSEFMADPVEEVSNG